MKQGTSTRKSNIRLARVGRWNTGFRFGLESEYLLVEAGTFRPLRYRELSFHELEAALESIPIADLPGIHSLAPQPTHRKLMPYYVEGYHVPDANTPDAELIPKGIEIRTPPCASIAETVDLLATLYDRLQEALTRRGFQAVALSHHPVEDHFDGPQGSRPQDRWQWCMQAMLTFGPDVSISLPPELAPEIDEVDLHKKVNFYGPALTAMSLASPIYREKPWIIDGSFGKSVRTYQRSLFGQALRCHPRQGGRLEFKSFEMSTRLADFHAYMLLWLTLLLDTRLEGRASNQSRVYDLGAVAKDGLAVEHIRERAAEVLHRATKVLPKWDFDPAPLKPFAYRLVTRRVPADDILTLYQKEQSLPGVLKHLAVLHPEKTGAQTESAVATLVSPATRLLTPVLSA